MVNPMAERHNHVWKPAFDLLVLWISSIANVLRLIALPTDNIPLNLLLPFPLSCLVSIVLSIDPVEPPGVYLRSVVEFTPLDPAGQANA
jgi:hypothetical protein